MNLTHNWRAVIRHAWSVRLLCAAGLLSGVEAALPFIDAAAEIPRGIFAGLTLATTMAAFVARLVAQQSVSGEADE
ncbi:hypothetical protein [Bosea sp. LjRoot237]|uniref:DUF7940 domain-containing protein n=1 Tax=Bosea sp. LjRoot237 TaxID=3342292 RepID=UPI003ECFFFAB